MLKKRHTFHEAWWALDDTELLQESPHDLPRSRLHTEDTFRADDALRLPMRHPSNTDLAWHASTLQHAA